MASPSDVARVVVEVATARPPTLGAGRLVCIDGPAGSGKTTLASAVAELVAAEIVHGDDLMEGWDGFDAVGRQLVSLTADLARGEPGHYEHYDWFRSRFDHAVTIQPAPWLVVEGVGSGDPAIADLVTVLVWIEVDDELRLARGLARDGVEMESHWRGFMTGERARFERDRTRERADVVVDGTGSAAPVVR